MLDFTSLIGFSAAAILALSLLPQVIKAYKTKSTRDMAWGWAGGLAIGFSLFLLYGILVDDLPIMVMNFFSLVQILLIIVAKIKYDNE